MIGSLVFFCVGIGVILTWYSIAFFQIAHKKRFENPEPQEWRAYKTRQNHLVYPLRFLQQKYEKLVKSIRLFSWYVTEDFIMFWYPTGISLNKAFPREVTKVTDYALGQLCLVGSERDWPTFLSKKVLSKFTSMLKMYKVSEQNVIESHEDFGEMDPDKQDRLIIENLTSNNFLHEGSGGGEAEIDWLRKWCSSLCAQVIRKEDIDCDTARIFSREIFTNCIFLPLTAYLHPYYINSALADMKDSQVNDDLLQETKEYEALHDMEEDEDADQGNFIKAIGQVPKKLATKISDTAKVMVRNDPKKEEAKTQERVQVVSGEPDNLIKHNFSNNVIIKLCQAEILFDPKPFTLYFLEVTDGKLVWRIGKRFSYFHAMHKQLVKDFNFTDLPPLPPKKMFNTMNERFIRQRKDDLQKYIHALLRTDARFTEVMRDFLIPPSWVEEHKEKQKRKSIRKKKKTKERSKTAPNIHKDRKMEDYEFSLRLQWDEYSTLVPVIFELIDTIFSLNKRTAVGQGYFQGVQFTIKYIFGSFVKKNIGSQMFNITKEDTASKAIDGLVNILWPDGIWFREGREAAPDPTNAEIKEAKDAARAKCKTIFPAAIRRTIGNRHVQHCCSKLWRFLQHEVLLKHFFYTVLDALLEELFPRSHKSSKASKSKDTKRNVMKPKDTFVQ